MNKLIIIDGNAIIHRAYHAIPPMTTKDGVVVNAVYGFVSMFLRVLKDLKPTHVAVTFDMAGGSTARLKMFKDYKATRVKADQALYDQIPLTHHAVEALGVAIYEAKGYEADDVIGTIVTQVKASKIKEVKDTEIFIVTGDMDTLQLIEPGVKVFTLRKGINDTVIYDDAEVKARFGFGPEKMIDYKAIRGDTSDNIPGVPGIGEKGATDLILQFGSLEKIYAELEKHPEAMAKKIKPGVYKKLVEGKESALMSKELATVDRAVPEIKFLLPDASLKPFDQEKILPVFSKFEFVSLMKRIPGVTAGGSEAPKEGAGKVKKIKRAEFKFSKVETSKEVKKILEVIEKEKQFSASISAVSKDFFNTEISGLAVVAGGEAYYLTGNAANEFLPVFENPEVTLIGHDLKTLIKILAVNKKIEVKNKCFDAMIASYLLNSGSRAHDIGSILLKELGHAPVSASGQNSLFGIDERAAAEELWLLCEASVVLKGNLKKADNLGLFETMEMPLLSVLSEMELNGVVLDTKKIQELSDRVKAEIKRISDKIYGLAGQEFNVASPLQLREILFEKLNIPVVGIKKGKTGLSTSAEELQKMKGLHPIIDEIEGYRELAKLQNTYIDVLPTLINPKTGRIHTTYNQAVAATGRLSSTDPNLQNIPVRTALGREVRSAFIAAPGYTLMSADYSQIELRIVASLAEDKRMMEIFKAGEDIHTATAAAINGVALKDVTKDMRRSAKEINFGILYGMGTYGLAWRAEIPHAEAKAFIEKYFKEFSGVRKYIDTTLEFTKKEGYCETLFGRRRYVPELRAQNFQVRAAAERMAINHPIQGTAADLMKIAMINVNNKLKGEIKKFPAEDVKMTMQVHDELVLEVKPVLVPALKKLLTEVMESVVTLRVPVEVQVASGSNWDALE